FRVLDSVAFDLVGLVLRLLVNDLSVLHHLLDREEATLEERLIILCLLELGVLGEVSELHGRVDALGHTLTAGGLQFVELGVDLLQTIRGDVDRLLKVVHGASALFAHGFFPCGFLVMISAEGRRSSALNRAYCSVPELYDTPTCPATFRSRVVSLC